MGRPNVNWNVGIALDKQSTYTSKAVKAGIPFASQVTEANTKYIIKYDFDLGGEEVTIPEDCILEFDGGCLKNGTVVGDGTQINASKVPIFTNITIGGTWNVSEITSAWFSDAAQTNRLKEVFKLSINTIIESEPTKTNYSRIVIEKGTYSVAATESTYHAILTAYSNTEIILLGTIQLETTDYKSYSILLLKGGNIQVSGSGSILGDKESHSEVIYSSGVGVQLSGENIYVSGITVAHTIGTCIAMGKISHYSKIEGVTVYDSYTNGISSTGSSYIKISSCHIYGVDGDPANGIDVEPQSGYSVEGIAIDNCTIHNCGYGIRLQNFYGEYIRNVSIESCTVVNCKQRGIYLLGGVQSCTVSDCLCHADGSATLSPASTQGTTSSISTRTGGYKGDFYGTNTIKNCYCYNNSNDTSYIASFESPNVIVENTTFKGYNGIITSNKSKELSINDCVIDCPILNLNGNNTSVIHSSIKLSSSLNAKSADGILIKDSIIDADHLNINGDSDSNSIYDNVIEGCTVSTATANFVKLVTFRNNNFENKVTLNGSLFQLRGNCSFIGNIFRKIASRSSQENPGSITLSYLIRGDQFSASISQLIFNDNIVYCGGLNRMIKMTDVNGVVEVINNKFILSTEEGVSNVSTYLMDVTYPKICNNGLFCNCGTTVVRTALNIPNDKIFYGFEFYDTDLSKPVYWTGDTTKGDNGWVDANGNNPSPSV